MSIFVAKPTNFISALSSTHKYVGGSIVFNTNISSSSDIDNTLPIFVDTKFADISMFAPTEYNGYRFFVFQLIAVLSDGSTSVLWQSLRIDMSDSASTSSVGVTLPKKVYQLNQQCVGVQLVCLSPDSSLPIVPSNSYCMDLNISTQTMYHYFEIWDPNSKIIVASQVTPTIQVSTVHLKYLYTDTESSVVIPAASFIATNATSINSHVHNADTLTGPLVWNVTDGSGNNIVGMKMMPYDAVSGSGYRAIISIDSSIYFNGTIYITATTTKGLTGKSKAISFMLSSTPEVSAPNNFHVSLPSPCPVLYTKFPLWYKPFATLTSQGTGPVDWQAIPIESYCGSNASNVVMSSSGAVGFSNGTQQYINGIYQVTATNILNCESLATNKTHIIFASKPILRFPSRIQAYVGYDTPFIYDGLLQVLPTTGPITWFISYPVGGISNVSIDTSTGVLSVSSNSYVEAIVKVSACNVLNDVATKTFVIDCIPQPYFSSSDCNVMKIPRHSTKTYNYKLETNPNIPTDWLLSSNTDLQNKCDIISSASIIDGYYCGSIKLKPTNVIDYANIVITAKHHPDYDWIGFNNEYSSFSKTITISCADDPVLVNPGYKRATMSNNDVIVPIYQTDDYTGHITWTYHTLNVVDPTTLYFDTKSTSNKGYLHIKNDYNVDTTITVYATNKSGAQCNVTFPLVVSQIPIIQPARIIYDVTSNQTVTYSMKRLTRDSNITWYADNRDHTCAINPTTGVITFNSNQGIHTNKTIHASNVYGESSNADIFISIQPIPEFECPNAIYGTIAYNLFKYTFQHSSTFQDIASWSISILSVLPDNVYISLYNNTNTLQYYDNNAPALSYFQGKIAVLATNSNSYVTSKYTNLYLLQPPLIIDVPDGTFTASMSTDYTYQMQLQQNYGPLSNLIEWSVDTLPGISIDPGTGILTFASNVYNYGTTFTVSASNGPCNGTPDEISFIAYVAQTPILVAPEASHVRCNLNPGAPWSYSVKQQQIAPGTGPLTWNRMSMTDPALDGNVNFNTTTAVLTVDTNSYAIGSVMISASNVVGGCSTIPIEINVAHTPIIIQHELEIPSSNLSPGDTWSCNIHYLQVGSGTGPLNWSISSSGGIGLINIDVTSGILSIDSNSYAIGTFDVTASNSAGGFCNAQISVNVAHTPSFTVPSYISKSLNPTLPGQDEATFDSLSYTIIQTAAGTGPIKWTLVTDEGSPNLVVDPDDGLITFVSHTSNEYVINKSMSVCAVNNASGNCIQPTTVTVVRSPLILSDMQKTINKDYGTDPISMSVQVSYNNYDAVGPLTWSVVDSNTHLHLQYLSISDSGLLTYCSTDHSQVPALIDRTVCVTASNVINASTHVDITLNLTQTPAISAPSPFLAGVSSYDMKTHVTNAECAGPLTWSIVNTSPGQISISISSDGVITFVDYGTDYFTFIVRATNINNVYTDVDCQINTNL